MENRQKIHLLSRELVPVIDDLDENAKNVVLEHIDYCTDCQKLYSNVNEMEKDYPQAPIPNQVEIKPLKKLVQFHRGLLFLMLAIRSLILIYIFYSGIHFYNWETSEESAIQYTQSVTFLFYFPASLFLSIFTYVFFERKWIWLSIIFDLIIIFFIGRIITLFV